MWIWEWGMDGEENEWHKPVCQARVRFRAVGSSNFRGRVRILAWKVLL